MRDLEFVTEPGGATEPGEVVSRPATRTPHPTRTGGQDDGSYTNSLKLKLLLGNYIPYTSVVVIC